MLPFRTRSTPTSPTSPTSHSSASSSGKTTDTQPEQPQQSQPSTEQRKPALSVYNLANIFLKMRQTKRRSKPNQIRYSSGDPKTHASLDSSKQEFVGRFQHVDRYVCSGGVNLHTLLRATRGSLIEEVETHGAKSLFDEQWNVTISEPRRHKGTFRVGVRYTASGSRTDASDPHKPVAIEEAKNIPGLMTILSRNE